MKKANKTDDAAMVAKMIQFAPELASDYAASYPMSRSRWYSPKEKGPKGEPCFIPIKGDERKLNYVFGRGTFGEGYYSLLTKDAYNILYHRMMHEVPMGTCYCGKAARQKYNDWDNVKRIVYYRSVASIPNDRVAAHDATDAARQMTKFWHLA